MKRIIAIEALPLMPWHAREQLLREMHKKPVSFYSRTGLRIVTRPTVPQGTVELTDRVSTAVCPPVNALHLIEDLERLHYRGRIKERDTSVTMPA